MPITQPRLFALYQAATEYVEAYETQTNAIKNILHQWHRKEITPDQAYDEFSNLLFAIPKPSAHETIRIEFVRYQHTHARNDRLREKKRVDQGYYKPDYLKSARSRPRPIEFPPIDPHAHLSMSPPREAPKMAPHNSIDALDPTETLALGEPEFDPNAIPAGMDPKIAMEIMAQVKREIQTESQGPGRLQTPDERALNEIDSEPARDPHEIIDP